MIFEDLDSEVKTNKKQEVVELGTLNYFSNAYIVQLIFAIHKIRPLIFQYSPE